MVKFKNRYFLLEIVCDDVPDVSTNRVFTIDGIRTAMLDALRELHGDYGTGAALHTLKVKVFNENTNIVVVRIRRECERLLGASLPFVSRIDKREAIFNTLYVGGSIRTCEKRLLPYYRRQLTCKLSKTKNLEERRNIQRVIRESYGVTLPASYA